MSRPPLSTNLGIDFISFITEDLMGRIWIGTIANGINVYDWRTNAAVHFEFDNSDSSRVPGQYATQERVFFGLADFY